MSRYAFAVLLLMLISVHSAAAQEPVTPLTQVQVSSFSVLPASTVQNRVIDFVLEIRNTGNLETRVEPEIEIYSGATLVEALRLSPVVLRVEQNVSLLKSYHVTLGVGEYRAVAKVYYANRSSYAWDEASLSVVAEREMPLLMKNESPHVRFIFYPVLIEGKPGAASAVSLELENPTGEGAGTLRIGIMGIPRAWVTLSEEELSLEGGQRAGVNLGISVPESALPGEHPVTLRISGAEEVASVSFIFRIRPYPEDFDKPTVLRRVYFDEERGRVAVSLEVENSGGEVESLELLEEIPKEIANSVEQVEFRPQAEVIEADPVIAWRLSGVDPYEVYTLEYEVAGIAPGYLKYIYWPLRQLNVIHAGVSGIELLQFSGALATYAFPGEEAEIKLRVVNPSLEALNLSFRIVTPPAWEVSPQQQNLVLLPGYAQDVVFTVTPAGDAPPGSYTLVAIAEGEEGEVSQPLTVVLQQPKKKINLKRFLIPFAALSAVALLVYAAIVIYRKKRAYRREMVEAVGRIRSSMEEE
jgi:hypothetical protein